MLEAELDKIHDFQKGKTSELARRIRVAEGSVERLVKEEEAYNAAMAEVGSSRAQAWQHAREESGAPANGNGNGNGNGGSDTITVNNGAAAKSGFSHGVWCLSLAVGGAVILFQL